MKATLYEALGIPQLASDEEVRAALRRLIRKYYAKTRDGQGNVEEALRFINHASRILSDRDHRLHYDKELSVTTEANTEQRIAHFVSNVAGTLGGSATRDDVIDIRFGERLFALAHEPKRFIRYDTGGHNDLDDYGSGAAARAFIAE